MTTPVDLESAATRVARLLDGITADQVTAPTPCTGISVDALLSHVLGLAEAFRGAAEKAPDPGPPPPVPDPLDPDWRRELPRRLAALVAAWRQPSAVEGMTAVGGVELPAHTAAVVALDELVLHGWDLSRASGQPYDVDQASVQVCLEFVAAAARPEGVPGLFGPPVDVPADAPPLDQLVGLSGRDPAWAPDRRAGHP